MKQGKWGEEGPYGSRDPRKTLGVIGIGNIGMIVAEKALALGMRVIVHDLYVPPEIARKKGIIAGRPRHPPSRPAIS